MIFEVSRYNGVKENACCTTIKSCKIPSNRLFWLVSTILINRAFASEYHKKEAKDQ